MTTTTENTTFEERLRARLKQMGEPVKKVYTEAQKEANRQRARGKYACRTEAQKEANRVHKRDLYAQTHPDSRAATKNAAREANERIAKMVEDSNRDDVTTTEPQPAIDNKPQKILYTGRTEEEREVHNERKRIRYANRTEEEKIEERTRKRVQYHKKHPNAKQLGVQVKRTDGYTRVNPPSPQWYVDACEEMEA